MSTKAWRDFLRILYNFMSGEIVHTADKELFGEYLKRIEKFVVDNEEKQ